MSLPLRLDKWSLRGSGSGISLLEEDAPATPSPHASRSRFFRVLLLLAFGLLTVQLWRLQIMNHQAYRTAAEENRLRLAPVPALRGLIYDRNRTALAMNSPSFRVELTEADLPTDRRKTVLAQTASLLGVPLDELESTIRAKAGSTPFTAITIAEHVPRELAMRIEEHTWELPGIAVQVSTLREYAEGPLLSQVMGYTALPSADAYAEKYRARGYAPEEQVGATGVEQLYEAELHGEAGARLYHVDAAGRPLQEREEQSPQPGHNLVLSIDADLQHAATDLLAAKLQAGPAAGPPTGTTAPGSGAVVIMDPRNGEVLSLVSLPTFDANVFTAPDREQEIGNLLADPGLPLFNRAVSGQYPPGSTFKLVTGIGALEERIADRNTRINCNGGLRIPNPYNPQLSTFLPDWGVLGTLDFIQGVAQSCNVYFYTLGGGFGNIQGLGSARLGQYAQLLGYGTSTGIDVPSETRGRVPNPEWKRAQFGEDWLPGDTYNMAIGQGFVLATPLQVAMVTNLIAMKGTAYRPHLVRAITDADGSEVRATTPEVVRQVTLRPDTLQTLRDGMIAVLDTPQARGSKLPGITVAGKTGTAEYSGERDAKGNLPTHGWFTAYAPANNPRVSVTVFLEYGGGPGDAYPLAMQIMREYLARYP